jgi:hypothetical protein
MRGRNTAVMLGIAMMVLCNLAWATPQYFPGTGHYYDVIADFTGLSWSEARAGAESQIWQGTIGYLACITSAEENQFVFDLTLGSGIWYPSAEWEVGPWLGGFQLPGSQEPDQGWTWINGEAWTYWNWMPGQPDNNGWEGANEDCLVFWGWAGEPAPTWNDYTNDRPAGPVNGYVVEFDVGTLSRSTSWGRVKATFR